MAYFPRIMKIKKKNLKISERYLNIWISYGIFPL